MQGTYFESPKSIWQKHDITASQADLGVTGRAAATVEALGSTKIAPIKVTNGAKALLLRFKTDSSEDDTNVLQVYAARDGDSYCKIAQLTITQGQHLDTGSIYFCDTITPANEDALFDGEESSITNHIGHYYLRTLGFDRFVIFASTLNSTTVYCNWAFLVD